MTRVHLPSPLSIDDAVRLLDTWDDLPTRRRGDLKSAVLAIGRLQGLPPGAVRLTPADLRASFMTRTACGYGISLSRQRNILSGLRYVMRRLNLIDEVNVPVMEAWSGLLLRVDTRKRAELITFARFCSARQIAPDAVTDADLAAFERQLTDRTLTPNPRKRVGYLKGFWNRSRNTIAGWPDTTLTRLRVHDYILPLPAFPASFQADLLAFGRHLSTTVFDELFPDEEDDEGVAEQAPAITKPRKPQRLSSVTTRLGHLRWGASALVATGIPVSEITSLKSLVQPMENAKAIIRNLYERAGNGPSAAGMHVAEALRIIAKYHAGLSSREVAQIKKWGERLKLKYDGMTEKNEALIQGMMVPHRQAAYRKLSAELMSQARKLLPKAPRQAASIAFRAVSILMLSRRPFRLENMRSLRLDQHLQRSDPRSGLISYIRIPASETKNDNEILVRVSSTMAMLLKEWINDYRPITASPGCVFLFPGHGTGNAAITPQAFREAIKKTMAQRLGVPMTPHRFRHLAARLFLKAHPGQHVAVQKLLNHKSIKTTTRHYNSAENDVSCEQYDEILDQPFERINRKKRTRR